MATQELSPVVAMRHELAEELAARLRGWYALDGCDVPSPASDRAKGLGRLGLPGVAAGTIVRIRIRISIFSFPSDPARGVASSGRGFVVTTVVHVLLPLERRAVDVESRCRGGEDALCMSPTRPPGGRIPLRRLCAAKTSSSSALRSRLTPKRTAVTEDRGDWALGRGSRSLRG